MKTRSLSLVLIAFILLLALPQAGQMHVAAAASPRAVAANPLLLTHVEDRQPGNVIASGGPPYLVYMPLVAKAAFSCYTGQSYGSLPPAGADSGPAQNSYDKNLNMRGYTTDTTGTLGYTNLTGTGLATAPRLWSILSPQPAPPFAHIYSVGKAPWDPGANPTPPYGWWPDKLLGITTTVGTQIHFPKSTVGNVASYSGGTFYGTVIYATASQITIVYTSWDKIVDGTNHGYGVHIANFCVDPNLLSLYNTDDAGGRHYLPGVGYNQAVGVANGSEVDVAITDSGSFMDPRDYGDWWRP